MNTFNKPKIYLISEPRLNWEEINKFFEDYELSWTEKPQQESDGDQLIEFAGRICYVSFGNKQGRKSNYEYLENLLSSGHGSVLEHANYTFLVTKASRGFTHEMVRHRSGFAYSQESTHYVDYSPETGQVNVPEQLNEFPELKSALEETAIKTFETYRLIFDTLTQSEVDKKVACSIARQILPTGIESKLVFTGNIRALRHFIGERATSYNVKEIRDVALGIYEIMKEKAPHCFMDMERFKDIDGYDSIKLVYRKV